MQLLILVGFLATKELATIGLCCACSCDPNLSAQEKYCRADFAVLVKVQDNGRIIGMCRVYRIKLVTTFKSNAYGSVNKRYVYTATSSAACGVILQKGSYYMLTGYYQRIGRPRGMQTGLCDLRQRFEFNPVKVHKPTNCNDGKTS